MPRTTSDNLLSNTSPDDALFCKKKMSRLVGKPTICICENKGADQLRGNRKLISAFVFATRIVQFLFYLKPKFQASSSFLCMYRPVCVGPVRKPHCWFSHEEAQMLKSLSERLFHFFLLFFAKLSILVNDCSVLSGRSQKVLGINRYCVFATQKVQYLFSLNLRFQASIFCGCIAWFVSDLDGNSGCWFLHTKAHLCSEDLTYC